MPLTLTLHFSFQNYFLQALKFEEVYLKYTEVFEV